MENKKYLEKTNKLLEILTAFKSGKCIEGYDRNTMKWYTIPNEEFLLNRLNKPEFLRIAVVDKEDKKQELKNYITQDITHHRQSLENNDVVDVLKDVIGNYNDIPIIKLHFNSNNKDATFKLVEPMKIIKETNKHFPYYSIYCDLELLISESNNDEDYALLKEWVDLYYDIVSSLPYSKEHLQSKFTYDYKDDHYEGISELRELEFKNYSDNEHSFEDAWKSVIEKKSQILLKLHFTSKDKYILQ